MKKHKGPIRNIKLSAIAALSWLLLACGGGSGGGGSAGSSGGSSGGTGGSGVSTGYSAMRWAVGPSTYASGAISTYLPSMTNIASGKVLSIFAQSETGGNKLYYMMGDIATATWTTPVQITGFSGAVQGVVGGSWPLPANPTVVAANLSRGVATAAWTSQVTGESTMRVWTSTYSYSGGNWSTPSQIGTASFSGLKIATSSVGGTLIGWLSASSANAGTQALNLYTIPVSGSVVTDQVEMGASPGSAVRVGLSDANGIVAVWAGASQTVMIARKSGSTWAASVSLGAGAPSSESDLDLAVNADGSDAVAWSGIDPSVHAVAHNASGASLNTQLVAIGSMGNTRPTIASLGSGKYIMAFAASSLSSTGYFYHEPYSSTYTPGTGWSTPIEMHVGGVDGAGNLQIRVDSSGNALAVNRAINLDGYSMASGATGWTASTNIVYGGGISAFVQEKSTGKGVILWPLASQLQSAFFK